MKTDGHEVVVTAAPLGTGEVLWAATCQEVECYWHAVSLDRGSAFFEAAVHREASATSTG